MKRALVFSAAFLAAVASCANPTDDMGNMADDPKLPADKKPIGSLGNEIKTGTRLRSRFVNGDDGSQIAVGLYDSKLNVECQFSEAEDGKTRCLPARTASLRVPDVFLTMYSGVRGFFKDTNCTERLATSSLCEPAARFIKYSDSCGGRPRIASAVDIAIPATLYVRRTDGTCSYISSASFPSLSELRFYTLGAPVQPEEFVAGTVTTD